MLSYRKRSDGKYRVYSTTSYMQIGSKDNKKFLATDAGNLWVGDNTSVGVVKDIQYSKGAVIITV